MQQQPSDLHLLLEADANARRGINLATSINQSSPNILGSIWIPVS